MIKNQTSSVEGIIPSICEHENVPPFNCVNYSPSENVSDVPVVSFTTVYSHMVSRKTKEEKPINNFKGLDKAVKHFEAGDISNIGYSKIDDSLMYVKAACLASMKKQRYQVYIAFINKECIEYAYCQCPIGLAQSCSHIGALLFALNAMHRNAPYKGESCTSKPCQWNIPRPLKLKSTPLSEWNLKRPKLRTDAEDDDLPIKKVFDFDPRHPSQQTFDASWSLKQLQELKRIFPNTGMSHLWNIPEETPSVIAEEEVPTSVDPNEVAMESLVLCQTNLPLPISIEKELSIFIEARTRGQRTNSMWHDLHKGRLTSSLFGSILQAGPNPASLVHQIIHGSNLNKYNSLPKPVQWGINNEKNALQEYLKLQNSTREVISVEEAGLTLYPSHAFLGTSSDGWVSDKSLPDILQQGCLEIKCPYSIKGQIIKDVEINKLLTMKEFCMEVTNEGAKLKKNHHYYAQVQGEMAIMGVTWCDFVVWTNAPQGNCIIERIPFDTQFVSQMMPNLLKFFTQHIANNYNHKAFV